MSYLDEEVGAVLDAVGREVHRAGELFPPMHGAHEAYAVTLEELDEVWELVKQKNPDYSAMQKEYIHVAAMAIRAVLDVCSPTVEGGAYEQNRAKQTQGNSKKAYPLEE